MAAVFDTMELGEDGQAYLENRGARSIIRRKTKVVYYVLTDNLVEGEPDVYTATNLPQIGYTVYRGYVCSNLDMKQTAIVMHPTYGVPCALYEVEATFDNNIESGEGGSQLQPTNPPDIRPVIRWHGEEVTRQLVLDTDGAPVRNTAGEIIYVDEPRTVLTLEISRWETYPYNPNNFFTYAGKKNSTTFWGAPAGACLMLPMEVDEDRINNRMFAKVTYKIKFDMVTWNSSYATVLKWSSGSWVPAALSEISPWDVLSLNEGYQYRNAAGEKPVTGDKTGNKRKYNLKPDGTVIDPATENMYFLRFRNRGTANFNALQLGPY
jgi:hypothetical protein